MLQPWFVRARPLSSPLDTSRMSVYNCRGGALNDHGELLNDADSIFGTLGMMIEELRRSDTARARLRQAVRSRVRWAGARPTSGMVTPGDRRGSARDAPRTCLPRPSCLQTAGPIRWDVSDACKCACGRTRLWREVHSDRAVASWLASTRTSCRLVSSTSTSSTSSPALRAVSTARSRRRRSSAATSTGQRECTTY